MKTLLLKISGDLWFAVKFVLIVTAFLFIGSIEITSCNDRVSRQQARWEQTTRGITQDMVSIKTGDGK